MHLLDFEMSQMDRTLHKMSCPAAERLHEMCTRCTHCISSSVHGQTVRESSPSRRIYGGEVSGRRLATKTRPEEQRAGADGRRSCTTVSQTSKLSEEAKEARSRVREGEYQNCDRTAGHASKDMQFLKT